MHGILARHEVLVAALRGDHRDPAGVDPDGEQRHADWHQAVHDWSFRHFPDPGHGEWYGYLHRDGSVAQRAKGNLFKGPFHLPRMLWYCARLLAR